MTTYTTATDIPQTLRTGGFLERLFIWSAVSLYNLFKSKTYKELENGSLERVIDLSIVQAADGTERILIRASMELDTTWRASTTGKLWTFVKELGDAALPAAYKAD